jgi:hypothetical protein
MFLAQSRREKIVIRCSIAVFWGNATIFVASVNAYNLECCATLNLQISIVLQDWERELELVREALTTKDKQ